MPFEAFGFKAFGLELVLALRASKPENDDSCMFSMGFEFFQRGTASLYRLMSCKVVSFQNWKSEKNSAAWPTAYYVVAA